MVETGDWWTPRLDYEPHWTKPPLAYWAVGAGIAVLGPNEWGARAGNGLVLVALSLAAGWLARLLWGPQTGALAGLIYATSLFPVVGTATISTDALLSLWELLAVGAYWAGVRGPAGRAGRWSLLMWAFFGLAFLTKGPPGLLSLVVLLAYHWAARRQGWPRGRLASGWGLAAFMVVGLGWYLDQVLRHPGLLRYLLGDEVLARVATDRFGRNPQWYKPPLIYGPPLALGLGGWLLVLPRGRDGEDATESREGLLSWLRATLGRSAERLRASPRASFLALWVALPVVFLSLSRSRLPLYVLPVFPALVLAAARVLHSRSPTGEAAWRRVRTVALVTAAALVAIKGAAARIPSGSDMRPVHRAVEGAERAELLGPRPPHAGPPAVVAVDEDRLYGLQFYLRGTMERAVTTPSPGDERPSLATALLRLSVAESPGEGRPVLLVSRHRRAVEEALTSLARPWTRVATAGRYSIWRVAPLDTETTGNGQVRGRSLR